MNSAGRLFMLLGGASGVHVLLIASGGLSTGLPRPPSPEVLRIRASMTEVTMSVRQRDEIETYTREMRRD